jgi:hypothetical protein
VYSRSSGAAWSSAARQYFRKAAEDLPSRGSFVYRGTQVVTGAKAREAAEDLLRQRPGVSAAPRQAFEARESAARSASPGSGASGAQAHRRGVPPAPPVRGAEPDVEPGPVSHSSREPGLIATAAVGGAGALVVTLPALVLATVALDPPLQPAFAALLLLLAAVAGALAASVWVRVRPRD